MHSVAVAFDGSSHSFRAIEKALTLMDPAQLHVRVLNVQEGVKMNEVVFRDSGADMQALRRAREEAGLQLLRTARTLLERGGVAHDLHVEVGEPGVLIPAFAKTHHCEMIVMGTRGLGTIRGLMLGSVASKVLHQAEVPVLLVK